MGKANGNFEERVISALIKLFAQKKNIDCQSLGIFFETQKGLILIKVTDLNVYKVPKTIEHVCGEAIVFIKGKASKRSVCFDPRIAHMLDMRQSRFRGAENEIIMKIMEVTSPGASVAKRRRKRDETHRLSTFKRRRYCER